MLKGITRAVCFLSAVTLTSLFTVHALKGEEGAVSYWVIGFLGFVMCFCAWYGWENE